MIYLVSWKEPYHVNSHTSWLVECFEEFATVEAALAYAKVKLANGFAVHVQPIKE